MSSTRPAVPSLSAANESGCATGVQPSVFEMNSTSSRSTSCEPQSRQLALSTVGVFSRTVTTMIFIFAR